MKTKVTLSGFNELNRALKQMPREMSEKVITDAHREGAKILLEAVRRNTPVGTVDRKYYGKEYAILRDSWTIVTVRRGVNKGEVLIGPRKKHPYKGFIAHMVEFGTSKMPAHPMMRPALEETKGLVVDRIRLMIGKKVLNTMRKYIKKAK